MGAVMSYQSLLVIPKQKDMCLAFPIGRCFFYFTTKQDEGKFSPPLAMAQPMRDCHNPANEKPPHLELPVSFNGLFLYNTTP